MQRFWSYIAVQLGKHAIWVTVIGLLVTIGLGLGITQLDFATGQDSYLNTNEQVYKDNVVYQRLFGGQAMLTVIRMDAGHTVDELFTGDGAEQFQHFSDTLKRSGKVEAVVSPLTILRFSDSLLTLRAFGGLVLLLVWLYLMANIIVLGAEINWFHWSRRQPSDEELAGLA